MGDIVFPHLSVLSINEVFFSVCLYLWKHRNVYLWPGLCLSSCAGVHLLKIDLSVLYWEIAKCPPYPSDAGVIVCRVKSNTRHWRLLNIKTDQNKKDVCWGNCKDLFTLNVWQCSCLLSALTEKICTLWARRRFSYIWREQLFTISVHEVLVWLKWYVPTWACLSGKFPL